jgi:heat shock protein HtpX
MNLASYKAGNQFKTFLFVAALTALLIGIGYLIGGASGLILFAAIAVVFNFVMYWFSGPLALKMSRAVPVSPQEEPELHEIIATLAERAGVPTPGVYVTPAEQPNAFATGRNPKHASIAVTAGIQRALGRRELEGVLAHEMAHIANRDILIASIAAMVAGAISAIANFLQFSLLFGGGDDDSPLGLIGTLATIILAPIAAVIIQLAISRQREFVADATGAEYVGDPNPLADALETLHRTAQAIPMRVNPAAEPLYIVNPLQANAHRRGGSGIFAKLFSTHPPMEERVARLRRMAGASSMQLQRF